MKNGLDPALTLLRDLLLFEQWLRFYFSTEEDGEMIMRVPENVARRVRENSPDLADLMDDLSGRPIDAAGALNTVFTAAAEALETDGPAPETLFLEPALQLELALFHDWAQGNERALDGKLYSFETWLLRFEDWKAADA